MASKFVPLAQDRRQLVRLASRRAPLLSEKTLTAQEAVVAALDHVLGELHAELHEHELHVAECRARIEHAQRVRAAAVRLASQEIGQ